MSRFLDVLSGDERDRDESDSRLPASDPLAVFHLMKQDAAPAASANELSSMKAAVAELRRARELARRSDEITGEVAIPRFAAEAPRLAPPARPARSWRLPSAAAALFAALVFFGGDGGNGHGDAPKALAAAPVASSAAAGGAAAYLPLVEDLDPRQAEMIQIEDEGMSLVVVLAAGSV